MLENNHTHFWNYMKTQEKFLDEADAPRLSDGSLQLPAESMKLYEATLAKYDVFRNIATVTKLNNESGRIIATSNEGTATLVTENGTIPETTDESVAFHVASYKLASMTRLKDVFVKDNRFDLEGYLMRTFGKRMGRAEENLFINGSGVNEPTGILTSATLGTKTVAANTVTYDDLVNLYFSLDSKYRQDAMFIMNDATAINLRTVKDTNGKPVLSEDMTMLLGKPVHFCTSMPNMATGAKAILFGDFSFYHLVERSPLSIQALFERYAIISQTGYIGREYVDGVLSKYDTVKYLQMA